MKKNLLTIIPLFVSIFSFSQPVTVTTADIVGVGKTIYQANDTLPAVSILPGGMGNQTWNFSALNNHYADTMLFMNPSLMPKASMFPSSNLGLQQGVASPAWVFLLNNSSGLYIIGQSGDLFGNGDTLAVVFSNNQRIVKFPANYNDIGSDTIVYQLTGAFISPGIDSLRIKHIGLSSYKIDAYGNLTTPLGTFSTLRQSEINHGHDSIFVHIPSPPMWAFAQESFDSSYVFRWWTNAPNVGFPLVEVTFDSTTMAAVSATWLLANPVNTAVTENSISNDAGIFPNPASDAVNFSMLNMNKAMIQVYDMNGNEIFSTPVMGTVTKFSTSAFANGIYLYRIVNADGKEMKNGKFIVNR
ncbi:MAG: T9SS type A sorting domain-containing protein [Bacteroidetes bacterium]|nr:T9SS type A sorting domain-containing protein [Bacteroidota bacterium]